MTIAADDSEYTYTGNASTTVFDGPRLFDAGHLEVYQTEDDITTQLTSGWSVSRVGPLYTACRVTFDTAPEDGVEITIRRTVPYEQNTSVRNQGVFLPEIHENAFDWIVMMIQQLVRGTLQLTLSGGKWVWNALGFRIINVGDPVDNGDAANKGYVDEQVASEQARAEAAEGQLQANIDKEAWWRRLGDKTLKDYIEKLLAGLPSGLGYFLQDGDGAVSRTFQDKGRELLSFADFGAAGDAVVASDGSVTGSDVSDLLLLAIAEAQASGKTLYVGPGNYVVSGTMSITGDIRIVGVSGQTKFYVNDWSGATQTTNQSTTAYTLFQLISPDGAGTDGTEASSADFTGQLHLEGLTFINADSSALTRVIHAGGTRWDSVYISGCRFENFTVVGVFGEFKYYANDDATNPYANSNTSINAVKLLGNYVSSDSNDTSQCPRSFHVYCCKDVLVQGNTFIGNGDGYLFRVNGGTYDTIPASTHGSANVRVIGNHFDPLVDSIEYNQITKTWNVVIADNTFDASRSTTPDNFFDCFNCINISFTGNSGTGGGLLFAGHADLGNGSYGSTLMGTRNVVAVGNSIINPSHEYVFNFGGDNSVTSARAFRSGVIANNSVHCTDSYTLPQTCYFFYGFLCQGLNFSGNVVRGINGYLYLYYCQHLLIDNEYLRGSGDTIIELTSSANDTQTIRAGQIFVVGSSTGKIAASTLLRAALLPSAQLTDYKATGYASTRTITFDVPLLAESTYELNVSKTTSSAIYHSKYLLSRYGSTLVQSSIVADSAITVTMNSSGYVTVTSSDTVSLNLRCALTRKMY